MKVFGNADATEEYGTPNATATDVTGVVVIGYDPAIDKWLALEWSHQKTIWLAGGGKEEGESYEQAAIRELREETGYTDSQGQIQLGGPIVSHYYNDKKAVYRRSYSYAFMFILDSTTRGKQALEAHEEFEVTWLDYASLRKALEQTGGGVEHWLAVLSRAHDYLSESGRLQRKENSQTIYDSDMETAAFPAYHQLSNLVVRWGDKVLLLHRLTEPFKGFWSVPGGGVEAGETYLEAAMRELIEEVGLESVDLKPLYIFVDHERKLESHIYSYASPDGKFQNREVNEHDRVVWKSIEDALQLQLTPGIYQALQRLSERG